MIKSKKKIFITQRKKHKETQLFLLIAKHKFRKKKTKKY